MATQRPLQLVCPAGHAHRPAAQDCPAAQRLPHAPQFVGSVCASTHAPLQSVRGAAHDARTQAPSVHC